MGNYSTSCWLLVPKLWVGTHTDCEIWHALNSYKNSLYFKALGLYQS